MLLWSLFHYARSSRDVSLNTSRSWRRINRSSVENSPPCLPERTPRGTHHCLSTRHVGVHPILLPTRKIIKRELIFLVYCLNVYFSITILESSFYFTNWSYYITNTNNWHLHSSNLTSHLGWIIHITCTVAVCCVLSLAHQVTHILDHYVLKGQVQTWEVYTHTHGKVHTHDLRYFHLVFYPSPSLFWGWTIHNSARTLKLSLTQYRTQNCIL